MKWAWEKYVRTFDNVTLLQTVQAIGIATYYKKEWPLLIIVPSSLRLQWATVANLACSSLNFSEFGRVDFAWRTYRECCNEW